jgi:hypothetical protein
VIETRGYSITARQPLIILARADLPRRGRHACGHQSGHDRDRQTNASAAVAAHPIDENALAKVASRDEVWRRRNWLRRACIRNHSWIAVADAAAMAPSALCG